MIPFKIAKLRTSPPLSDAYRICHPDPESTSQNAKLPSVKMPHGKLIHIVVSNSHILRHHLQTAKREVALCLTNAASILTLLLIIVFIIGAETTLHDRSRLPDAPSPSDILTNRNLLPLSRRPPTNLTPIQAQLHEHFTIPWRYINLMTHPQQHTLFDMLSTPAPNATIPQLKRRALLAHITDCRLHQCLRAVATAVAYAHVTTRIAIIFVDSIANAPVTKHIRVASNSRLAPHALLIAVPPAHAAFINAHNASLSDWAEFTVVDAIVKSDIPTGGAHSAKSSSILSANPAAHSPPRQHVATGRAGDTSDGTGDDSTATTVSDMDDADDADVLNRPLTIGNSNTPATLDNLAAMDTHVAVTLSEVFWSRYAPRTTQEAFLHFSFQPVSQSSAAALTSASLLGRHYSTRTLSRTDTKLHDVFNVPYMFLHGMRPLARKLLLLKLQTKVRRGVRNPAAIFVHTQYGLGNRLRALGSAMAFARRTDRVLVLIWVPDQHLNCRYTDLFVTSDEFVVADAFEPGEKWPFANNSKTDPAMKQIKWYNYMRVNGVKVTESSDLVLDDKGCHIYVSTCYVIQSPVTPFIIRTTSSFWSVLKSLTPHINVIGLVERLSSYPVSHMIGIHIRGKSIKTDISGINEKDYTEESSRTTDYWRNLTQVDTFIEEMKRQTANQLFYVAADQKEVLTRLEREFPSRVFYTPRHCDSRDRDCLPFALADILLLAKCASLRGSYWSSFSELSTRIGGARFLLAGIDFGRP